MKGVSRILVANRGEIAVRIIRACQSMGIESVAVFSSADRDSLATRIADRAVCLGPPRATDSYLNMDLLITAALGTRSDAMHPGYGFLAEKPELTEACERQGIIFIGPSAENIRQMGNKLWARRMAGQCGVPTVPGSEGLRDLAEAARIAQEIGFPILLKAAAGGGGRGMKIIRDEQGLQESFDTLSAEVESSFGDGTLYMERHIPNARHVEVQVLGDHFGNVVHLGERDCSIQRRHQKLIEEAPSPMLAPGLRREIWEAATTMARDMGYRSAGTIEFILDLEWGRFHFLEMNTRIQVEHPVTEMVTGMDIVQEQIRIAGGQRLSFTQEDVQFRGHAIECRINAESPFRGFLPCAGRIETWIPPQGSGLRIDSHCFPGCTVPPYYDSLIAKVIATGADRLKAMERMGSGLDRFVITGVDTTIPFHKLVLKHPDFREGRVNTRWLEDVLLREMREHDE